MIESKRSSGIDIIGDVSWGTHFCQFYQTKEDLMDLLVPYFKAGLENNEFCMWVTSRPLSVEDAKEALRMVVPDIDVYLEKGQIEIIPHTEWYVKEGFFDSEKVLNGWIEKLNQALANGYNGLRLTGNTFWLEKEDWNDFVDYEKEVDRVLGNYQMIALCTYSLDICNATEIIDVVTNHQFALIKREGNWERIESSKLKKAEEIATLQSLQKKMEEQKRKRADNALRESERRYHQLFENMLDGFAYCKMLYDDCGHPVDFIYLDTNSAFECLTGLKGAKGKRATELIPGIKKLHPELFDIYDRVALTGQPERFEIDFKPLGIWLSISVYSTERERCVAVFDNITVRKKAEGALKKAHDRLEEKVKKRTSELEEAYESLKESEKGLAEAQKMAHIGNWDWDIATDKAYWSDELYHIFGRNPQELAPSYNEYLNYVHPNDRDYADSAHKKALNGKAFSIDHRIILANGEERTVHTQTEVIFDDKNIPIRLKGIVQDITERKRAEEKIRNLANVVESSNDAIGTMSLDGIITSWNKGSEQIYGYSAKEILMKPGSLLAPSHSDKETRKLIEMVKQGKKVHNYVTSRLRKDGKMIDVSLNLSPVINAYGKLTAISVIARDITESKRAEEALKNFEIARKKEIHHRIKNNLQVIYSLLDLQAEQFSNRECIKDSEVMEAFRESQNRVTSMALIHEELYRGGETDRLDFSSYIKELAENLLLLYRVGNKDISLNMDLEENAFFDIDTAIQLGIIINELVSNSFKYALQGRDKGEIRIRLRREESNNTSFVLSISDNGIGIPEYLEIENLDSLGLQLVTTLVNQLDGELELKRKNGTEFTIKFTVIEKSNQASTPQFIE